MSGRILTEASQGRTPGVLELSSPHRAARHTLFSALRINLRVVGALVMREASSRFGRDNIGIFWIMGEPLILAMGVIAIWTVVGGTHGHDVGLVPFILSGYTMLTLWRHILGRSVHVVRGGAGLLFHRNIAVLDVILARAVIEVVGILTAFFVAYVPLSLFGVMEPIRDPLLLIGAWMLCALFSFGCGMIIAALTEMSEIAERFVQPFLYLTLPVTGSLFMVCWMPERAQEVVLWSPLVNAMEMFRDGLFSSDVPTRWYAGYTFVCCLVVDVVGFALLVMAQDHVRME